MDDLRRLKFAYARGARIQFLCELIKPPEWLTIDIPTWSDRSYRIHRDDDHLGYGPISAAVRDMALGTCAVDFEMARRTAVGLGLCQGGHADAGVGLVPEYEWRMYLLFVAEALADDGL